MTDLATLGLRIMSQEAELAEDRLDDMAMAAGRADTATDRLATAARRADGAVGTMNVAVRQQTAVLATTRGAMGLTAAEGLNLSRQFADIGVTAAMGMNPLMIALQQGPQLLDIFSMAAARTGATVTTVMRGVAASAVAAVAPFAPLILAVGAVATVIGGTLALSVRGLNKDFGDLTKGMGLTADQLKNVQDKGVTMGDVVGGTLNYLRDIIWDVIGPAVTQIGKWFSEAMDVTGRVIVSGAKIITGSFIGAFRVIKETWTALPSAFGDVVFGAVNALIRGINMMISKSADAINWLRREYNKLPSWARGGQDAPVLAAFSIGEVENPYAGAARRTGEVAGREFAAGFAEGAGLVDRQVTALQASIRAAAQSRIRREAGDAEGGARRAGGAQRDATGLERIPLTRNAPNMGEPLRALSDDLITPLEMLATELRLIDALAGDVSRGLSSAFGEGGRALGDLLTVTTAYQSRLAEIGLAVEQNRLTTVQAAREKSQAEAGYYGDVASAARGFFKEGSDGYRVLQAAEQAFRLVQLAGMLQSMATDTTLTGSSVANSLARGAASAAAGAAKMFEMLGPLGFPLVAGMVALLAGLGLRSLSRGGKSGGSYTPAPLNDGSIGRAQVASEAPGRQVVEVRVAASEYFDARVEQVSGPVAQRAAGQMGRQVLDASRRAAPGLQQRQSRLGST